MEQGIYIATSGAKIQQLRLEISSNNLANVNTSGYKADRLGSRSFEFDLEDAFLEQNNYRKIRDPEYIDMLDEPVKAYSGIYTKTNIVGTDFSQGHHKFTGSPLHASLEGPGFFVVETQNGTAYTRQCNFALDSDGELVTSDGLKVVGRGLSKLDEGELTIDADGTVYVDGSKKGSIDIVEFESAADLTKIGHNLYTPASQAREPYDAEETIVKQGYVENPNISVVQEMVDLIEINRLFETYQKMITSIDESTGKIINEVGSK